MPHTDPAAAQPAPRRAAPRGKYARLLQRYRRLMDISRDLLATLDLPVLLTRIVEAARELTGAEAANLLLTEPSGGDLQFAASTRAGSRPTAEARSVPLAGSLAGWIVAHGEPMLIADAAQDGRRFAQAEHWQDGQVFSVVGVPLRGRSQIIGVLEAVNKRAAGGFSADDVDALAALAAQAAVAIETARLFQQSDQVAEMLHELRTPLASLAATSHLLLRPDLPEERRQDLVEAIQTETARLATLTQDFLDLSRLESGRTSFSPTPFQAPELAAECLRLVQPQAQERGIACLLEIAPEAEACPPVVGDRAKIKQVLLNLLTNAIKYNRPGGRIAVRGACRDGCFETSVSDTGPGIPAESLPHIFDKFYRVSGAEDSAPGAGLGLAIARRIVEAHGGAISAESSLGEGTTIRFTLPLSG